MSINAPQARPDEHVSRIDGLVGRVADAFKHLFDKSPQGKFRDATCSHALLRHFNHNFKASVAARSVQFVGINDICEWQAVRNELTYIDPTSRDQVKCGPRGCLVWFDSCSHDGLRATAFVKQNIEVERDRLPSRVAEV